jgi:hypothetical protein
MHREDEEDFKVNTTQPHFSVIQPVFSNLDEDAPIVGYIMGIAAFDAYLINLMSERVGAMYVVVENTCGAAFTYKLTGYQAGTFFGCWRLSRRRL